MVFSREDVNLLKVAVNGQKEGETPRYTEEELKNLEAGTANQHVSFKAQKDVKKLRKRQKQLKKQATNYRKGPISREEVNKHFLTKREYSQAQEGLLALINALVEAKVIKKVDIEKAFQIKQATDCPDMCEYCEKDKGDCTEAGIVKKDAVLAVKHYPLLGKKALGKKVLECKSFVHASEPVPVEPTKSGAGDGRES